MKSIAQNPAIARYMAALKRAQNAPQKFHFPDLASVDFRALVKKAQEASGDKVEFSSRELTIAYVREFDRLNYLVHVEPVFGSPEKTLTPQPEKEPAMNTQPQPPAVDRALAVLRASLGNVQPAAPAPKPQPRPQKAVAQAQKPAKPRAKPAPQPAHDVWYYFGQQKARTERRARQ